MVFGDGESNNVI